jgi:tetratricopeptide (TPR) repeat protein
MKCDEVRDRALVERYLADRLDPAEKTEFEAHYVDCTRCQEELRLGALLREELGSGAAIRPTRAVRLRSWGVPIAVAAAAALAAVILLRDDGADAELRELGRIGVLPETPSTVVMGSEEPGADSLLASGMQAYRQGDHGTAVKDFEAALQTGGDSLFAAFYLGASLLAQDRASEAAEAYRRVIGAEDTLYGTASRYYLAKALLREGRVEEALGHLRTAEHEDSEFGRRAAGLADSVAEAMEEETSRE